MKRPIIPLLVKAFDPLLNRHSWAQLERVLKQLKVVDDLFFVQIGANDGVIHDPLYQHIVANNWQGILVEPVRYYFDRLIQNYANNSGLIFENVAISNHDGDQEFYRIKEGLDFMPAWTEGLGSFRLDVLLKHKFIIPNIQDYIIKERVECLSFASLLNRHAVKKIDLIMIDTEGYDFEILKQIDLVNIKPKVIVYEHKHISRAERRECASYLQDHDYHLESRFSNTLAYLV